MDEEKPKSTGWWLTVPGILTAVAAILTALGGLIVASRQAGFFEHTPERTPTMQTSSTIALSPDPFYLASSPSSVLQQSNVHGGLQLGRVYWQTEVWIENLQYEHAVGMHAPDNGVGYADFKIPLGAKSFQTIFGLARDDKSSNNFGNAIGRVYLDNDLVWESAVSGAKAMHTPAIPVPSGTKRLRLEVDSQGIIIAPIDCRRNWKTYPV